MGPANIEFVELLNRSGWSQSEAARQLELTSASVSRYVNNVDPPDKQTLRLFRMLLADKSPAHEFRETPPSYAAPAPPKKAVAKIRAQVQNMRKQLDTIESTLDEI